MTPWLCSWVLAALVACTLSTMVDGVPANPVGQYYRQPDGTTTPLLYLKGDEHYSWLTDASGYTVIPDSQDWHVYAAKKNGSLESTGARVGDTDPETLALQKNLKTDAHLLPTNLLLEADETGDHRSLGSIQSMCDYSTSATCRIKGLVLLVRFKEHQPGGSNPRNLPDPEDYGVLFNHNGPTDDRIAPTGSVADVFLENSYGKFVLESVVTPWIDVDRTEEETVDDYFGLNRAGTKQTWKEAMTMLENSGFDLDQFDENADNRFDALVILHSGMAAEIGGDDCESGKDYTQRIWSHATSSSWFTSSSGISVGRFYVSSGLWGKCPKENGQDKPFGKWDISRIGVIAHECAHYLGLPDLYDTVGGLGLGNFDMQANMWGWHQNQLNPPMLGAWSKQKLGWVNVLHVSYSDTFILRQACTSDTILRINHNMPECEYFLVENRYPCSFDIDLEHESGTESRNRWGVAIWHVDECNFLGTYKDEQGTVRNVIDYQTDGSPFDDTWPARHYKIALVQGDGFFHLERGINQGDNTDLFKQDDSPHAMNSAYYIGPEGVKRNLASDWAYPNTASYADGKETATGIHIEVGAPGSDMIVRVTLDGADSPPTMKVNFSGPESIAEPGFEATFTVSVTIASGDSPVTVKSLGNDAFGDLNGKGSCLLPFKLVPGGALECSFAEYVSGNKGDTLTSVVTAVGTDNHGASIAASGTAKFEVVGGTTLRPTSRPTSRPTDRPTLAPTPNPTPGPSLGPTPQPTTSHPTPSPSPEPTTVPPKPYPTHAPSPLPTPAPISTQPTPSPSPSPTTSHPTPIPTAAPTPSPTSAPTIQPTPSPTIQQTTANPTTSPTPQPTLEAPRMSISLRTGANGANGANGGNSDREDIVNGFKEESLGPTCDNSERSAVLFREPKRGTRRRRCRFIHQRQCGYTLVEDTTKTVASVCQIQCDERCQ